MSFNWVWLLENLQSKCFLTTLSIKNGVYSFLIRLYENETNLIWKWCKDYVNYMLILYENDVKIKLIIC